MAHVTYFSLHIYFNTSDIFLPERLTFLCKIILSLSKACFLHPIREGGGGRGGSEGKKAPCQFFPCNFYKRKNKHPKTFLLLVLTFLAKWCKISRP